MSDQQLVTPTTPSVFYAVAWGNQRGVFVNYKEAQAAMKGFPSPTWKKFKNREEAESFVNRSKPESTSVHVDDSFTKFFAVARGRVVGIFKDMDTVKKNTKGYPSAMHKKFDTLEEAQHYLEKYFEGKADEKKSPRKSSRISASAKEETTAKTPDVEEGGEQQTANDDESGTKPVARKRTYGTKVNDEHDGEAKLDSSEGRKELRGEEVKGETADVEMREEEEAASGVEGPNKNEAKGDEASGMKEQGKQPGDKSVEDEAIAVNGEQQTVATGENKKMQEVELDQHEAAAVDSDKKEKLIDSEGMEQTSQQ